MSLPSFINLYSDNFFSQENLIQDLNTSYLLSLKETSGLSEKTNNINLREDAQPTSIEIYDPIVDFDKETREKLTNESVSSMYNKTSNICRVLRNSILEYHMRNSVQFSFNASERLYNPLCVRAGIFSLIFA